MTSTFKKIDFCVFFLNIYILKSMFASISCPIHLWENEDSQKKFSVMSVEAVRHPVWDHWGISSRIVEGVVISFRISMTLSSPDHSYQTYSLTLKFRYTSEFSKEVYPFLQQEYVWGWKGDKLGERVQRPCLSFSLGFSEPTNLPCIEEVLSKHLVAGWIPLTIYSFKILLLCTFS